MLDNLSITLLLAAENGMYYRSNTSIYMDEIPTWKPLTDSGYIEPKTSLVKSDYTDTKGRRTYQHVHAVVVTEKGKQYLDTLTAQEKVDIIAVFSSGNSTYSIETYITASYLPKYFNQLTIDVLPKYLASEHANIRKLAQERLEELQRG